MPRLRALDGPLFYALLPWRVRRLAREHRPVAIVTQSPYEAACVWLARTGAKVIVELHGDWRTATRLYGSPLRRRALAARRRGRRRSACAAPTRCARSRPTRRTSSASSASSRRGEFAAFMDLELFLERPPAPLPSAPAALFVGVLELYKNVDGLARAWRLAAPRVPGAQLRIVGRGTRREVIEQLVRELPAQTSWTERLTQAEVARALDEATCLVLPSRSEGLGRVLSRRSCAAARRSRWASAASPTSSTDGVNGLLVDTDEELADALVRVLTDRALAERLGAGRAQRGERWLTTPEEFAERLAARRRSRPRRTLDRDDRPAGQAARQERALPHDRRDLDRAPARRRTASTRCGS